MAIVDEIRNLSTHLQNAYIAAANKEATIPTNKNMTNLAECIATIHGGEDVSDYFKTSNFQNTSSTNTLTNQIIKKFPDIDCSRLATLSYAFANFKGLEAPTLLNTNLVTVMDHIFYRNSNILELSNLNTENVRDFNNAFYGCSNLIGLPLLNGKYMNNIIGSFGNCSSLILFNGLVNIGQSYLTTVSANYSNYIYNLSSCKNLTHDSLVNIIDNLYNIKDKGVRIQKLILGSTNLAKLTAAEIAVATNKGWTVS